MRDIDTLLLYLICAGPVRTRSLHAVFSDAVGSQPRHEENRPLNTSGHAPQIPASRGDATSAHVNGVGTPSAHHSLRSGSQGRSGGRRAGQAARQSSANAAGRTSAAAGAGQQFRHAAGSNTAADASGGLLGETAGRTSAAAGAGQQFRHAAGSNTAADASGGLLGETAGLTSAAAGAGQQFRHAAGSNTAAAASGGLLGETAGLTSAAAGAGQQFRHAAGTTSAYTAPGGQLRQAAGSSSPDPPSGGLFRQPAGLTSGDPAPGGSLGQTALNSSPDPAPGGPFSQAAGRSSPDPASGCRSGHEDGRRSADPSAGGQLGQVAGWSSANTPTGAHLLFLPSCEPVPDAPFCPSAGMTSADPAVDGVLGQAAWRTDANPAAGVLLRPTARRIPDDTNTNGVFSPPGGAELGGHFGEANGRTWTNSGADEPLIPNAGGTEAGDAVGGQTGDAYGRATTHAADHELHGHVAEPTSDVEEARAAHRALQRENQRLLNELEELRRSLSRSTSPAETSGGAGEQQEPSPNSGNVAANVQPGRHPIVPINDRLLGRAVGNAHARGTEHGLQHLTPEQEVLAFDLAAAMRRVPEVAMLDALTVLFWDMPDGRMDFWPSRKVLLGALATALKYKTVGQRTDLLHVYLFDPVRRGYIRNKLQDGRHVILHTGRCGIYRAFDLYIQRPDQNRKLMGSTLIEAWKVQYKPVDGSYDLYTWHCNQNGVPFSNAVFTRLIAASFRRDGEDVLVLKLKQIAFWLYGVSECNVLF
ncbi:unnamed protein product [Closterium sp. Naga37s-1]|nr:unnamed protein product [Closterium sp. Naga37s-1]